MQYSRAHPSERYAELIALYARMHAEGHAAGNARPEQTFTGQSLLPQAGRIKRLIERSGAATLLDYGCGKGLQYEMLVTDVDDGGEQKSVVDYWDVSGVCCYDPGYPPFRALPEGRFDGVICTDVLEHCPQEDLDWILDEIFGYAQKFVFANVASYPARKVLANGENAHCTLQPPEWWDRTLRDCAARHPGILWEVWVRFRGADGTAVDQRLGNFPADT